MRTIYAVHTTVHHGEATSTVYAWRDMRRGGKVKAPVAWYVCGGPKGDRCGVANLSRVTRRGLREIAPAVLDLTVRDTLDGFLAEAIEAWAAKS